jgi:hypothetical protein
LLSNYYLVNGASGKVLDDPSGSTTNGTSIQQYQLNGGSNQQWQVGSLSNGNDYIMNAASGKVLTAIGSSIQQYSWNGGTNQQWRFKLLPDGNDEIMNAASGEVLDDPGGSTANQTPIQQYPLNGGSNQQWKVLGAGNSPTIGPVFVANGASGKVLDDPSGSMANGTHIQQYQLNRGSNQQWTFVPLASGYDVIVNSASGLVLDDPGGSTSSGTWIQQYQLNGGANQQWYLPTFADGNREIMNAASGMVLDDPGGSMANQTWIQQYRPNGGANQEWALFVPNPTPGTSSNWSGYVAATSISQPQSNSVSSVSGSWVVPRVDGPSSGTTHSAVWVGIDGFSNGTVEQVGTEQDVVNGTPVYDAWWEMFSTGRQQPEQVITGMTVMPGDSITASVQFISSGTHANQFYLSIVDNSRSNDSFSTYQMSSQTQSPLAQRNCAEWIVEAPTIVGSGIASLADFGSVTFTSASAVINGVSGAINSSSWQSQALNMTSDGTSRGTALDTTSVLTNSGKNFVVIDDSSVGSAVQSGTNVGAGTKSGPAVGSTLQSRKRMGSPAIGGPAWAGASDLARFRTPIGQPARPVQGSSINQTALGALFAAWDAADNSAPRVQGLGGPASTRRHHDGLAT